MGAFPSDMALLKLIYLAQQNISEKWVMPLRNWSQTAQQLAIWFGERMQLDLKRNFTKGGKMTQFKLYSPQVIIGAITGYWLK
uniref:hypothetical protein n=1 Tax=Pontibacter pamirensis TaxID=2562824 RepID=UPI0013897B12|nr:hypothetical protein [Pontibacter pamirensis]